MEAMIKIAQDYKANVQTIIQSDLSTQKKQGILKCISEQLTVLCDRHQVPDLTNQERAALREVYTKTRMALHQLTNEYEVTS